MAPKDAFAMLEAAKPTLCHHFAVASWLLRMTAGQIPAALAGAAAAGQLAGTAAGQPAN
jgi:hypothetical protein